MWHNLGAHAALGLQVGASVQQQLHCVRVPTLCRSQKRCGASLRGPVSRLRTAHHRLAALSTHQRRRRFVDSRPQAVLCLAPSTRSSRPARDVWRGHWHRPPAACSLSNSLSCSVSTMAWGHHAVAPKAHLFEISPVDRRARVEQTSCFGGVPSLRRLPVGRPHCFRVYCRRCHALSLEGWRASASSARRQDPRWVFACLCLGQLLGCSRFALH